MQSFQVAVDIRHVGVHTCQDDMVHGEDVDSKAMVHKQDVVEVCAWGLVVLPMDCNSEAACHMVVEEVLAHIQANPWDLV